MYPCSFILSIFAASGTPSRRTIIASDSIKVLIYSFNPEHIDRLHIRAAEEGCPLFLSRLGDFPAISEDVYIWEGHMHGHGTEFSPFAVKIPGISRAMAPMAGAGPFPVHAGNPYLRSSRHQSSTSRHFSTGIPLKLSFAS